MDTERRQAAIVVALNSKGIRHALRGENDLAIDHFIAALRLCRNNFASKNPALAKALQSRRHHRRTHDRTCNPAFEQDDNREQANFENITHMSRTMTTQTPARTTRTRTSLPVCTPNASATAGGVLEVDERDNVKNETSASTPSAMTATRPDAGSETNRFLDLQNKSKLSRLTMVIVLYNLGLVNQRMNNFRRCNMTYHAIFSLLRKTFPFLAPWIRNHQLLLQQQEQQQQQQQTVLLVGSALTGMISFLQRQELLPCPPPLAAAA